MPTLVEEWSSQKSIQPSFIRAAALPRLIPQSDSSNSSIEHYEVLVVGAGPSGLMLTTGLTRYGLPATSVLCIDARPHQTLVGNADGLAARTLEILGQFGLESEFLRHGAPFMECTVWMRDEGKPDVLERKMAMPFFMAPARYEQLVALHQGHVERVFKEDIRRYQGGDIQYGAKLVDMRIDEEGDSFFPVLAKVEINGVIKDVRTKYLIGSDGAKSTVRNYMNVGTEGEVKEELWGVIDLVADSDFPDLRRQSSMNGGEFTGGLKGGFIVPRERLSNGDWLTRLYLDMSVTNNEADLSDNTPAEPQQQATKEKRDRITEALILERAADLFHPFRFQVKKGTKVHWWAAFSLSQNLAKSFILQDSYLHPRVFITGDACHSHSPRQGQGMNVSIQDAYNLAWKLAYAISGIAADASQLLKSYEDERLPNARNLINFDKTMNDGGPMTEEKMALMKQFSTACGIEYGKGIGVNKEQVARGKWSDQDYLDGVICPGRRLLNSKVNRFANGTPRDIHDEIGAEGKFSVMLLAGIDFGTQGSRSSKAAETLCTEVVSGYPPGIVQIIILCSEKASQLEWADLPACIKQQAEMSVFLASGDVYGTYGVKVHGDRAGRLVVVRPDGIVGLAVGLDDIGIVNKFLGGLIKRIKRLSGRL
ncbi:hypothetical protein VTL71DRAFT_8838 [Oculimacula yallundae]|uniref:Phenol 2-monooxygenase n=1 Tax=Oculimacula yallundae TaxID=86028 RepID=A0ABR4CYY0_9HELO